MDKVGHVRPKLDQLSAKVRQLLFKLEQLYTTNQATRCIVFVDRRLTAKLLADCFISLVPHLRPGRLLGVAGDPIGDEVENERQHEDTMQQFRDGLINCKPRPLISVVRTN